MIRQTGTPDPCFCARSVRASTTFRLQRVHRRTNRHDFNSPIGVVGVGKAV